MRRKDHNEKKRSQWEDKITMRRWNHNEKISTIKRWDHNEKIRSQ